MRILVLSDHRLPTMADGHHGLGVSVHSIATGLAERGHTVALVAHPDSQFDAGTLHGFVSESEAANVISWQLWDDFCPDVVLDSSHGHMLSRVQPEWPVLNRICDRECKWQPPNVVVNSAFMQRHYPKAKHASTGINLAAIPFSDKPNGHYAFMSTHQQHKGWPMVKEFAVLNDIELEVARNLHGQEKWDWLGFATALLHPSSIDAAPRLPLEAAACGTPTICLNLDGTVDHVEDGLTGFICEDWKGIENALTSVKMLDRNLIRTRVERTHAHAPMINRYDELLQRIANGERW